MQIFVPLQIIDNETRFQFIPKKKEHPSQMDLERANGTSVSSNNLKGFIIKMYIFHLRRIVTY